VRAVFAVIAWCSSLLPLLLVAIASSMIPFMKCAGGTCARCGGCGCGGARTSHLRTFICASSVVLAHHALRPASVRSSAVRVKGEIAAALQRRGL
jgi:hypothetical protein